MVKIASYTRKVILKCRLLISVNLLNLKTEICHYLLNNQSFYIHESQSKTQHS